MSPFPLRLVRQVVVEEGIAYGYTGLLLGDFERDKKKSARGTIGGKRRRRRAWGLSGVLLYAEDTLPWGWSAGREER